MQIRLTPGNEKAYAKIASEHSVTVTVVVNWWLARLLDRGKQVNVLGFVSKSRKLKSKPFYDNISKPKTTGKISISFDKIKYPKNMGSTKRNTNP